MASLQEETTRNERVTTEQLTGHELTAYGYSPLLAQEPPTTMTVLTTLNGAYVGKDAQTAA